MTTTKVNVHMTCKNCVQGVKDAVTDALGDKVTSVDCSLDTQIATIVHTGDVAAVFDAIKEWAEEVDHKVCIYRRNQWQGQAWG